MVNKTKKAIKKDNTKSFFTNTYRSFIDNKININELKKRLDSKNIILPSEFYLLSKPEQKRYYRYQSTIVHLTKKFESEEQEIVFNSNYFYWLATQATKSISVTNELISYLHDLKEVNLIFLGMQQIKVKNTRLRLNEKMMEYIKKKKIHNLYELTIDLIGSPHFSSDEKNLADKLIVFLKAENSLGFDLNDAINKFFFLMENLLHVLPKKEVNTLKIKFLVLNKDHLRKRDYYDLHKSARGILRDYQFRGVFTTGALSKLKSHLKDNPYLIDGMYPNGYMALYYAFIADSEVK